MGFRPLHDRVLIERLEPGEESVGKIIIPDTSKEKPIEGVVIAVGDGAKSCDKSEAVQFSVKKGDRVLFGKWAGTDVKLNGKDYVVMKESDIIGVFE